MPNPRDRLPYPDQFLSMAEFLVDSIGREIDEILDGFEPCLSGGYRARLHREDDRTLLPPPEPAHDAELHFD